MSENAKYFDPAHGSMSIKKLMDHLSRLETQTGSTGPKESDMLSLIVSEALNGEDISTSHPAFYNQLLENAELRQAFLDALAVIEAERAGQLTALPGISPINLDFLDKETAPPAIEKNNKQNWRVTWQRTLEQIRSIFLPPTPAYRSDLDLLEDPWFTLLREQLKSDEVTYDIALDCTLSAESDNALTTYVSLAVTWEAAQKTAPFPLRAELQWGDYQASITLTEEGRLRLPDIPMDQIFDPAQQLRTGLSLTLETLS